MEHTGLEPVTSTLPVWRAPNCANAPKKLYLNSCNYDNIRIMKNIELNERNLKLLGRTLPCENGLLMSLSGTGVEFDYTGCGLDITLKAGAASSVPDNDANYARIAVYVDGLRVIDTQLSVPETTLHIAESDTAHTSRIRLIKLSEAAMSLVYVDRIEIGDEESVNPVPVSDHKIEFIGDSITCGYGVDDEDPLHPFKTATEDVTRAYAYKTAMQLGADYSMFSASGYGIISGYTDDPDKRNEPELIPPYYESMGLSHDSLPGMPDTQDIKWDFNRFRPDVVVINLGTNDDSFCQDDDVKQEEYTERYSKFLKVVRSRNLDAQIFCILGLMGDRLYPCVCDAVSRYVDETGDMRIGTVHLTEQDAEAGYVSDYHPLESAHAKAAEELIRAIRTMPAFARSSHPSA